MDKQRLFEYIRGEDVVIWAGAGFSKYAGYPLGGQLRDLLFQQLSEEEKSLLDPKGPLDSLSEEFVRLRDGDRSHLNEILKDIFLQPPVDSSQHNLLASIPHIKNIITTNYDELFEYAYKGSYTRLIEDKDVPKVDRNKVNIIKFHGDLSVPSSIVLTKEDYARFYNEDKAAPLRALVTELIATKVVLFIGYGYEDPNVWALFAHLIGLIKGNRKDAYCIAPALAAHKIRYLQRNGITYINDTAEHFLGELHDDIRNNIFADFPQRRIGPDTFRKYLNQHNVKPGLTGDEAGFRISSLEGLSAPLKGSLSFSVNEGSDITTRYGEFFEKGFVSDLELGEGQVSDVKISMEGLNLYPGVDISKIVLKKKPQPIIEYDLVFPDTGFEINDLKADFYRGSKQATVKTVIHNLTLEFTINRKVDPSVHINFKLADSYAYRNVKDALDAYRFIELFYSGELFTVYFKEGGAEGFTKNLDFPVPERADIAKSFMAYLKKLRRVEQAFHIRFTNFKLTDGHEEAILDRLLSVIDKQSISVYSPDIGLKMEEIYPEALISLRTLNEGNHDIDIDWSTLEDFCIHGFRFRIRRLGLKIPSVVVTNLAELESGNMREIKLISRSGYIYENYSMDNNLVERVSDTDE